MQKTVKALSQMLSICKACVSVSGANTAEIDAENSARMRPEKAYQNIPLIFVR